MKLENFENKKKVSTHVKKNNDFVKISELKICFNKKCIKTNVCWFKIIVHDIENVRDLKFFSIFSWNNLKIDNMTLKSTITV